MSQRRRTVNCGGGEVGGGGGEYSNCLICYAEIDGNLSLGKIKKTGKIGSATLTKHLDVILILKQIFELSSEQLKEYLVKSTESVEKWIRLCGKCGKLVDKYKNILGKLFKMKLKLIGIAKQSFNDNDISVNVPRTSTDEKTEEPPQNCLPSCGFNVTEQSRKFIKEHNYNSGHQFLTVPAAATTTDHFRITTAAADDGDYDNPRPQNEDKINPLQDNFDIDSLFESADSHPNSPSADPQLSPEENIKPLTSRRRRRPKPELILPTPRNPTEEDIDQDWLPDSSDSDISNDDPNPLEDNLPLDVDILISDVKPALPITTTPSKISTKVGCHLCPKSFHDKSTLTRHLINIHKQTIPRKPKKNYGKSTKCSICSKKFSTPSLLHYHQQFTHLKQFDLQCPICQRGFRTSKDLQYHQKVCQLKSTGGSKVSCPHEGCKARYWNEDGLKKHLSLHEKGLSWQCYQCGKSFLSETALKTHEKTYHDDKAEEVICEFCGDRFATKISLYSHKKISLRCQLNFQRKSEAECKFTCEICGDKFGSQRALQMHVDTRHNNKYPFNCGEEGCGKGFVQRSKLAYHLKKVHDKGEYPWKCEVEGCGMGYDSRRVLEEHMSTHGGEKGFECWECGKKFYFSKGLEGHRKKVHAIGSGGRGVSCDKCGRGFKSLVYLRHHLKSCGVKGKGESI